MPSTEKHRKTIVHEALQQHTNNVIQSSVERANQWSTARKLFISATIIFMNFNVTMGSSLSSGASDILDARFGVLSPLQVPLPVCLFLVGYVTGPIVFAPMSESIGRRPVFWSSFAIYTVFLIGCAFAPSWSTFLFFRFMMGCGAAAPQTVSNGLFADIYVDLGPRGRAVTILGLTSNVGALVGPIVSGYTWTIQWQWQYWIPLILVGVSWIMLLLLPETFTPAVKSQHFQCDENASDNSGSGKNTPASLEPWPDSSFSLSLLTRPIRILSEPIVLFTDIFILYQYTIFFLYFGAYPLIFKDTYDLTDGQSALMFIPTGIGAVLAIFIFLAWDAYHRKAAKSGRPWAHIEEYRRLPLACLGGPLFAISEFWLVSINKPNSPPPNDTWNANKIKQGWTARPDIHWSIPALSGVPLGIGIDLSFLALSNYLTDAYDIYSASAWASCVITRNLVAAIVIPFATYPLHQSLGTGWSCTLLGFLCVALVPIPFIFLKWGHVLRARSSFCQQIARLKEGTDKEVSEQIA